MVENTRKFTPTPITDQKLSTSDSFTDVGGLAEHIKTLKELIIFPFIYQNLYQKFKIRPARGVLFYGPPGTGKTLLAGILAKECSKELNRTVTFYSRKGADILNKWVGESEQNLKDLFIEASMNKPSIIFFDEIDGLAPVRSMKQDQVHSSIVATLLSLMDGLEALQGVIVIGATNRIDSIDPALRRPGRFDKELFFPLPNAIGRKEILEINTRTWYRKPTVAFLTHLAEMTAGFSGSDLNALCCEAVMICLRRHYPKIHTNKVKIALKSLIVSENDFMEARKFIIPSSNRTTVSALRKLPSLIKPLLKRQLDFILDQIYQKYPHFKNPYYKYNTGFSRYNGRLLLMGESNQGHNTYLGPAILHALEHIPQYIIDIQSMYKTSAVTAEESCVEKLTQAKMNPPSILLVYKLDEWWDVVSESTRAIIMSILDETHAGLPILLIATATNILPCCFTNSFTNHDSVVYTMENPNEEEIATFFHDLFLEDAASKCYDQDKKGHSSKSITYFTKSRKALSVNCVNDKKRKRNTRFNKSFSSDSGARRRRKFENQENLLVKPKLSSNHSNSSRAWSPIVNFAKKLQSITFNQSTDSEQTDKQIMVNQFLKNFETEVNLDDPNILNIEKVKYLFNRAVKCCAKRSIINIELLYDMLYTCIHHSYNDSISLLKDISIILTNFENKFVEMEPDVKI